MRRADSGRTDAGRVREGRVGMRMGQRRAGLAISAAALALTVAAGAARGETGVEKAPLRFEVSFPATVRSSPADGRVFVIVTREGSPEPRLQLGWDTQGVPFFGVNVDGLAPGTPAVVDDRAEGYLVRRVGELPAGDYTVQALLSLYHTFHRADGHVVKMHRDAGEGQRFEAAPGNLTSAPVKVHLDPATGGAVRLSLDRVIPPVPPAPDTPYVKHVSIRSELLSKFWGEPVTLEATVLLPKGYDREPGVRYPVIYEQGHFSKAPPGLFGVRGHAPATADTDEEREARDQWFDGFDEAWLSPSFPRMLLVTFQHPTPYYDDSYAVDSPNSGPYGSAIVRELIPYIEEHFRAIPQPYARVLTGGSTGGWEALALQVFHPDFFGGTFAYCPDPVDFRAMQLVNIYDWPSAWTVTAGWMELPIPAAVTPTGMVFSTMEQQLAYERVRGDRGRSGEQWDAWQATFGPVGEDGYFKPLFDPRTGAIDKNVAAYWKEHWDLRHILESHWPELAPKLTGKLHVWVGDMDTFYLNNAVHLLDDFLKGRKGTPFRYSVVYGPRQPHGWSGPGNLAGRVREIAAYVAGNAPQGADASWNR